MGKMESKELGKGEKKNLIEKIGIGKERIEKISGQRENENWVKGELK